MARSTFTESPRLIRGSRAALSWPALLWPALLAIFLLGSGCGARSRPRQTQSPVGRYTSAARTFSTNSYWIDAPEGLILIGAQFLPEEALEAVERAEDATGKRVVAAFVLHPNPDKFNGTEVLQARGIRVLTSSQVAREIPAVHRIRWAAFHGRYRSYPQRAAEPERFGAQSRTFSVAGTELMLHVLGRGCSEAHVALSWRGHLFVGDLVSNHHHAWMELGYLQAWRTRLEELAALSPTRVHPGRGDSGGPELLRAQDRYLRRVQRLVGHALDRSRPTLTGAPFSALLEAVESEFPGFAHPIFLRMGLPRVYRRLGTGDLATP